MSGKTHYVLPSSGKWKVKKAVQTGVPVFLIIKRMLRSLRERTVKSRAQNWLFITGIIRYPERTVTGRTHFHQGVRYVL
jgi:hypothetical protein